MASDMTAGFPHYFLEKSLHVKKNVYFCSLNNNDKKVSMKRTLVILSIFVTALATMVSCKKEDPALVAVGDGVLKGEFSVSPEKKVRFSKGNLQCQIADVATKTVVWNFASTQYEAIGSGNSAIGAANTNAIDLFGWGTSGWESGAVAYQPYSFSTTNSDYWPGGDAKNNLTGTCMKADWGRNNPIMNGGMLPGAWRVLTSEEWEYLIKGRPNAEAKLGVGAVLANHGLILLPDNWTPPADTNVKFISGLNPRVGTQDYNINWYSEEDWQKMEETGAVFLPVTGYRNGKTVDGFDFHGTQVGNYWSSTAQRPSTALGLHFTSDKIVPQSYAYRHFGRAVRLVRDI